MRLSIYLYIYICVRVYMYMYIWGGGFPKLGVPYRGPFNKDYDILGVYIAPLLWGITICVYQGVALGFGAQWLMLSFGHWSCPFDVAVHVGPCCRTRLQGLA